MNYLLEYYQEVQAGVRCKKCGGNVMYFLDDPPHCLQCGNYPAQVGTAPDYKITRPYHRRAKRSKSESLEVSL